MRWLVIVSLCVSLSARAEVLVAGNPALDQSMVDRTCDLLEWALDLQMTVAQRTHARDALVAVWKAKDKEAIASEQQLLDTYDKLVKLTQAQRDEARAKITPLVVDGLKKQAKDPINTWLLGVYDAAHVELAKGDVALTRQMLDAYVELVEFVASEAAGKPITIDAKLRAETAKQIAAKWPKLDKAQQQQFAQLPSTWAGLRVAWAKTPEDQRAQLRTQWRAAMAPKQDHPVTAAEFYKTMNNYRMMSKMIQMQHEAMMMAMGGYHYEWQWVYP
jgi:hypothetical protein